MKIVLNKEIKAFLKRCENNMQRDYKNDFIGLKVRPQGEKEVQYQLRKAGFGEFMKDESTWPSLFLSSADFKATPYYKHIKLDTIQHEQVRISQEIISQHRLMNAGAIVWDEHQELNDWMRLRALDAPLETTVLRIDDQVWMLDVFAEAFTIDPCALKAHGQVLTFGCGIGYFVYMALTNQAVDHITIIENNQAVIDIFKEHILPQFDQNHKVTILHEDAFGYFNESNLSRYDYVFVDIHQSSLDGLEIMDKLLSNYLPPLEQVDFWIETSILEILIGMVFYYFNALAYGRSYHHQDEFYDYYLKKIACYFESVDLVVEDSETLKHFMYDRETLRKILNVSL